jgi:hypothetical protein
MTFLPSVPTANEQEIDMRRLWTRKSRSRLFLMTAAVSVITLAAGHVVASAGARGTSTVSADCSEATARQVVEQHPNVNIFALEDPVRQVLCGPFTGEGSNAMAVTIGAPTCWPIQNWAVFSFTAGDWQLVLNKPAYLVPPLVAVGSDIRETAAVRRGDDTRCLPKGGTHARIWHWDGTRLVAGPWKQVTKAEPFTRTFYSPSKNVTCSLGDESDYVGVICTSFRAPQRVKMAVSGRLKICHGLRCLGCGCAPEGVPKLAYGRQITVGRFRCLSRRSGVRCTVISLGKGFLINRDRIKRVGP